MRDSFGAFIIVLSCIFGYRVLSVLVSDFYDPALIWGYGREIIACYGLMFLCFTLVGIASGFMLIFSGPTSRARKARKEGK